ncbi:MAG: acyl-CoA dehydrogenase, partial [Cellvibrionales bacterium]|nr:acyl-CoA dehydrogenase [Cellvibrionales bacterium]
MYSAPTDDMQFLIDDVLTVEQRLGGLPRFSDMGVGVDLTTALLDEAAKLGADMVSPLRRVGDSHPATCTEGKVSIPPGYAEAIQALGAGGWVGICADVEA